MKLILHYQILISRYPMYIHVKAKEQRFSTINFTLYYFFPILLIFHKPNIALIQQLEFLTIIVISNQESNSNQSFQVPVKTLGKKQK